MRLYSRTGATAVNDGGKHYTPADDAGGFDFPEDVAARLHSFHAGGKPLWEDSIERQARLVGEERERRADPATLLAAVEKLVAQAEATPSGKPAAKTTTVKAPASK
jgi:hypothetical protein